MPLTPQEAHDLQVLDAHFGGAQPKPAMPNVSQTPAGQIKNFEAGVDLQKNTQQNLINESNKTLDPTAASRKSMLENAQVNLDTTNQIMRNPDGSVNDITAFTGRNNIPWTKGSQAHNALQNALSAQLRAETGAGAPASEIEEMAKRFMPSIWDSDDEQKQKLDNIQRLIDGTYKNMLPKLQQKNPPAKPPKPDEDAVIDYKEYFK